MHLFEVSAPLNKCICFKMVENPIEVGHALAYFMSRMNLLAHAMPFSHSLFLNEEHMVYVSK